MVKIEISLNESNQGFNHYVNPPAREKRKSQTRNPPRSKTKNTQTKAQKADAIIKKTNESADKTHHTPRNENIAKPTHTTT